MNGQKLYRVLIKKNLILPFLLLCFSLLCFYAPSLKADASESGEQENMAEQYREYMDRLDGINSETDIEAGGFRRIKSQVFTVALRNFGEVLFIPALDEQYNRLALFLVAKDGSIVYKTDNLETNYRNRGQLSQPNKGIAGVSFQDMNGDGLTDIVLITSCLNETKAYGGNTYKVGDVLFQNRQGFYRDWRLSDKINRFSMNKSIKFITSFILEGQSTECLYTATTLDELLKQGFEISPEQSYWRQFEKMGRLKVVPGTIHIAEYSVFMIYLVNDQGYIVWSFQPMGDYDNLYALKGITCRDIDGDGMKDLVVLARYSYESEAGEEVIESDYSIYYQRTGGFYADEEIKKEHPWKDGNTLDELVNTAREYWGWGTES